MSDPLDLDSNDRGSDWIRQGGRDLRCVECDRRAPRGAPGWRAYRTLEHDGSAGTAVYCPSCARRYRIADVEALIEASAGSALPADGGAPATTPGVDRAKNGPKRRH